MSCEKAGIGMTRMTRRKECGTTFKKEVAARNASENWIAKGKGGKKIAFHGFNAAYITRKRRERSDGRDVQLPRISNPECERKIHAKRDNLLSNSICSIHSN